MKTLLLIFTLLVCACTPTPIPDSPLIVTQVTNRMLEQPLTKNVYRIEVNDMIYFDTDSLYAVGDTIK